MASIRSLYLANVGQTSEMPLMLEVEKAHGVHMYDTSGKRYIDMNSGISVSSVGHSHPKIIEAIHKQSSSYLHTMVYGEHIQQPQVAYANALIASLDPSLETLYYLMSGTEATELAMKIGKKYTNKYEIVACANAYHGSTHGAESLRSDMDYKAPYQPLLPGIKHIRFNHIEDLEKITCRTACVITEVVQGEAGVITPTKEFLLALRAHCTKMKTLLVFDEIQSGFGRTGTLFAHQAYGVVPDILLVGKAMGGGLPLAGVITSREIMSCLVKSPALGHITTFGGHPLSCATALAAFEIIREEQLMEGVTAKANLIIETLSAHPIIKEVRSAGLMMAVESTKRKYLKHIVQRAMELGVIVDWFLFNNRSFRMAPPLVIKEEEIVEACALLLEAMDYAQAQYA